MGEVPNEPPGWALLPVAVELLLAPLDPAGTEPPDMTVPLPVLLETGPTVEPAEVPPAAAVVPPVVVVVEPVPAGEVEPEIVTPPIVTEPETWRLGLPLASTPTDTFTLAPF